MSVFQMIICLDILIKYIKSSSSSIKLFKKYYEVNMVNMDFNNVHISSKIRNSFHKYPNTSKSVLFCGVQKIIKLNFGPNKVPTMQNFMLQ